MESSIAVSMAEHIARCAASGLSCAEYARREGISLKRLYNARDRARTRLKKSISQRTLAPKAPVKKAVLFKPVRVSEPVGLDVSLRCVLHLAGGHRLELNRLPEPQWLADLSNTSMAAR